MLLFPIKKRRGTGEISRSVIYQMLIKRQKSKLWFTSSKKLPIYTMSNLKTRFVSKRSA